MRQCHVFLSSCSLGEYFSCLSDINLNGNYTMSLLSGKPVQVSTNIWRCNTADMYLVSAADNVQLLSDLVKAFWTRTQSERLWWNRSKSSSLLRPDTFKHNTCFITVSNVVSWVRPWIFHFKYWSARPSKKCKEGSQSSTVLRNTTSSLCWFMQQSTCTKQRPSVLQLFHCFQVNDHEIGNLGWLDSYLW
jgi:hypothetical protein